MASSVQHQPSPGTLIQGLRVLVVEDSYLAARSLVDMVQALGATVVGPAPTVEAAIRLLGEAECDAAILDINLSGASVEPVAEQLERTGIPFFFVSGYNSPRLLGDRYRRWRRLAKPVDVGALRSAVLAEFTHP